MIRSNLATLAVVALQALSVRAGGCLSVPDDDPPLTQPGQFDGSANPGDTLATGFLACKNQVADNAWACNQPGIDFPTVECLKADMLACGNIGGSDNVQSIFYSFGASNTDVKNQVRNPANGAAIMIEDTIDSNYVKAVLNGPQNFQIGQIFTNRWFTFADRWSAAYAQLSQGDVLVVMPSRIDPNPDSTAITKGSGQGAYRPFVINAQRRATWSVVELSELQHNSAVSSIISIGLDDINTRVTDWTQADQDPNDPQAPLIPISDRFNDPVPAVDTKRKRQDPGSTADASACILPQSFSAAPPPPASSGEAPPASSSAAPPPVSSAAPPPPASSSAAPPVSSGVAPPPATSAAAPPSSITAAPSPAISCELNHPDPDQGVNTPFCLCSGSTLPVLPVPTNGQESDSCAYSTIPATGTISISTLAQTFTSNCQVCTQIEFNAPSCTRVADPGCTPTNSPAPSAAPGSPFSVTVEAGSSPVHIGTLAPTALSASISSVLSALCPNPTGSSPQVCSEAKATIQPITYVDKGDLVQHNGELVVHVEASSYTDSKMRDIMISAAGLTAQKAAERSGSCKMVRAEQFPERRSTPESWYESSRYSPRNMFAKRVGPIPPAIEMLEVCDTNDFAGVQHFNAGRIDQFIDVNWSFELVPGSDMDCEFIADLTAALVDLIEPELIAADGILKEDIEAVCSLAEQITSGSQ